jgi:RNA polymerase sigma factor FliA
MTELTREHDHAGVETVVADRGSGAGGVSGAGGSVGIGGVSGAGGSVGIGGVSGSVGSGGVSGAAAGIAPVTARSAGAPTNPALVEAGILGLWRAYSDHREVSARDRLVLHYCPLVKYVAGRVGTGLPAHVDVADLIQAGIFGLVDAIERFEPDRGLRFEPYAIQRIRGAILDDLRAQDWVPRSVRSRAREFEHTMERLEAKLHRSASDAEVAGALGITVGQLRELLAQLWLTSVVALDELIVAGGGWVTADTLADRHAQDPVLAMEDQETRRLLAEAIAQLGERDRTVVILYYFENLTLAEVGRVLGVTESRASQLHTGAVLRLRGKLGGAGSWLS